MVFAGIGLSLALPSAQASVLGAVSQEAVGKAAGTNTMMRELGGVFGIAVAVAIFAEAGSYVSPQAFVDGLGPALGGGCRAGGSGGDRRSLAARSSAGEGADRRPDANPGIRDRVINEGGKR